MSAVVNQPYSTSGNGGRKLVRLSNGWEVAVTKRTGRFDFFVNKQDGNGWKELAFYSNDFIENNDIAIVANGTKIYGVFGFRSASVYDLTFDATTVSGDLVNRSQFESGQTALGNVTLAINPQGTELHAAWSSKNTTYPNSFNIRYAKGTINADGSVTWGAATQMINPSNYVGVDNMNPTVVCHNGLPVIIYEQKNGTVNHSIMYHRYNGSVWSNNSVYNPGAIYAQSSPSTVIDKDGVIHVAWHGRDISTSFGNIFYSKSTDGGTTWSTAQKLTTGDRSYTPSLTVDKNNKMFIMFNDNVDGDVYYAISKLTYANGVWSAVQISDDTGQMNPSTLYDPTFTGSFGDTPPLIYMDGAKQQVTYAGTYSTNTAPTASLVSPTNNQTLYENDILSIAGEAYDANKDQSVTVYYQVNNEPRKVLATNLSQTQISLSKQLTFKGSKLFDGEVAITGVLADGVAHTLKVWAVDSESGQSATIERTFYVVPNRAPLLSVDAVVPSGVVDTDIFKISGISSDPDANSNVKVTRKINGGNPVEIYNGPGGAWEFEVLLAQLKVGENTIVVEVVDNYGAKTSKTIKIKKNEVKTPILHAVGRYKIKPPAGSAKGVLLFIERDEEMDLKVELSMTLAGEQEQYETLTADNTAPMPNTNSIVEDTYYYEATEPKDNIILKLSTTRPDATVNHKIHLISGAVE